MSKNVIFNKYKKIRKEKNFTIFSEYVKILIQYKQSILRRIEKK